MIHILLWFHFDFRSFSFQISLSNTAPNVDFVYWTNEAERVKADLHQSRLSLEKIRSEINAGENLQSVIAERDTLRRENSASASGLDELRRKNQDLRTASAELEGNVLELQRRCELELKAHQAAVDSFADTRNDLAVATAALNEYKNVEKQLTATISDLSRSSEEQQRVHASESALAERGAEEQYGVEGDVLWVDAVVFERLLRVRAEDTARKNGCVFPLNFWAIASDTIKNERKIFDAHRRNSFFSFPLPSWIIQGKKIHQKIMSLLKSFTIRTLTLTPGGNISTIVFCTEKEIYSKDIMAV